ncbi:MAG: sulfurtransferase-like selenium metabolism protein YedF [Candidatus Zipacnadales bacterium]
MVSEQRVLDCRGKLCPKPLLETKRAMATLSDGSLKVIVDSLSAKENVTRAMIEAGHEVLTEEGEGEWTLIITKTQAASAPSGETSAGTKAAGKTVVFATDQGLGRTNPDLGAVLMRAFLAAIAELPQPPDTVALMQGGVWLACEGSPVLDTLRTLETQGTELIVCGTCLEFFGVMDQLRVGRVSNMAEITHALMTAGRIIPL